MESLGAGLQTHTLNHLTELQHLASTLIAKQSSIEQQNQELSALRKQVLQLLKRKADLESALKAIEVKESTTPQDSLSTNRLSKRAREELSSQLQKSGPQDAKRRNLGQIAEAYRLAGQTLFELDDDFIGIRIETFHAGRYYERYYVVLDHTADQSSLFIHRHTIPHFIALQPLAIRLLNKDISKFMDRLSDQLNAFVFRREELKSIESTHADIIKSVSATPAFTYIKLVCFLRSTRKEAEIYLIFDDLSGSLPTQATVVTFPVDGSSTAAEREAVRDIRKGERLRGCEDMFLSMPMAEAFGAFVAKIQSENGRQ
eukprot:GILJ01012616.1.p1 GENE.GILJ01012616.1~~GILJ01012616.1.p1  ORF type:complete len:315 (+),score=46.43 GILJ01012616.1:49-993(+)